MKMRMIPLALAVAAALPLSAALAAGESTELRKVEWSFEGVFGGYDRAQLQRGFLVYKDVCSVCHGLKLLSYRNLGQPGGPEFPEAAVKAIAASVQVPDLDEAGEPTTRPGTPADRFVSPYPNEKAARAANNGSLPPDLSVITKARLDGVNYLYSILTGYADPPADMTMNAGMNYNLYFPGHQIAMPAPLVVDGQVTYADGTPATIDQMAKDVSAFLAWAAEPKLEERKSLGFKVILFLMALTALLYLSYKRLWRDIEH